MSRTLLFAMLVSSLTMPTLAQNIQVSRQNKTIAVTAEETVSAEPEIAIVSLGCHNYGPTKDAAFQTNARVSAQIVQALLDAHIPKDSIETSKLHLGATDLDEKWSPEMRKEREFEAHQSWTIRVQASQAGTLVSIATRAGVNDIQGVTWTVAEPAKLQAKASGAALAKARSIAEQMAQGLGAKLGDLVYASNSAPSREQYVEAFWQRRDGVEIYGKLGENPKVELYPTKVASTATVNAIFAID
jgi:uncharacterized protein